MLLYLTLHAQAKKDVIAMTEPGVDTIESMQHGNVVMSNYLMRPLNLP